MSKHVYYVGGRSDGCYYVRCLVPMRANGWDGDIVSLRGTPKDYPSAARAAMRADVVVFQRPDDPQKLKLAEILKQQGKTIVFDNDDTYIPDSGIPTQMESYHEKEVLERMNKQLYDFIETSDIVTTTTEFLAEEYRKLHNNVVVLPNMVAPLDWYEPKRNESDKVRIGFVGSVATAQDYEPIADLIRELSDDPNVQLVLHAIPPDTESRKKVRQAWKKEIAFWDSIDCEWVPPVPIKDYMRSLNDLKLDIMLIPRLESYFNKCKSNIKFLEASMCEIPVIASSFPNGPYENDKHITLATDDWREKVYELINDKKRRRAQGRKAKQYVLQNYNIDKRKYEYKEAYQRQRN